MAELETTSKTGQTANYLTEFEQAKQLAERKGIYLELYPDTKAGVSQAKGMNKTKGNNVSDTMSPTFASDTSSKTGKSKRTIERKVAIGEKPGNL